MIHCREEGCIFHFILTRGSVLTLFFPERYWKLDQKWMGSIDSDKFNTSNHRSAKSTFGSNSDNRLQYIDIQSAGRTAKQWKLRASFSSSKFMNFLQQPVFHPTSSNNSIVNEPKRSPYVARDINKNASYIPQRWCGLHGGGRQFHSSTPERFWTIESQMEPFVCSEFNFSLKSWEWSVEGGPWPNQNFNSQNVWLFGFYLFVHSTSKSPMALLIMAIIAYKGNFSMWAKQTRSSWFNSA